MKKILVLLLVSMSGCLQAENGMSAYVSLFDTPLQIISDGDESRVFLYGVSVEGSGCASQTSPVLLIGPNQAIGSELYSTLLAAKTTGKQVKLVTNGCFLSEYPTVFSIYLDE